MDLIRGIKFGCTKLYCNAFAGMEMAQLVCGGCRTLLMYTRGATSVRCSCCHTLNLASGTVYLFTEGSDIFQHYVMTLQNIKFLVLHKSRSFCISLVKIEVYKALFLMIQLRSLFYLYYIMNYSFGMAFP